MNNLIVQTKFDFEKFINFETIKGSHYSQIELKNRKIIIYEMFDRKNKISLLNKNFKLKTIFECDNYLHNNIIKVIQLTNNKILFCSKDLFVLNIKSNEIKKKEFPEEKVLDIIELKNKKILGITEKHLIYINIKGEELEITNIMDVPQNSFSKENMINEFLRQYLDLYEISNNKILIHSHLNGLERIICGNSIPTEKIFNKIYILDLNDFSNIYNFKLMKQIDDKISKNYIIKYDENLIIGLSDIAKENNIIVYNLAKINEISFKIYYGNFEFKEKTMQNRVLRFSKKKSLSKLQNGSLSIICHGRLFIIEFPDEVKYTKFQPLPV